MFGVGEKARGIEKEEAKFEGENTYPEIFIWFHVLWTGREKTGRGLYER